MESGKSLLWILTTSLLITNFTHAKELFSLGDGKIQVLSDKAYRKTQFNSYEAHGNVIIKLQDDTIYGEKASISLEKGEAVVLGNVRYVGSLFTLYATKLTYDLNKKSVIAENAKLVNPGYTIVGKEITRKEDQFFYAKDAEYTTCKDCPQSWSILGTDVKVIPERYIFIKHGYLKANGVVIVYIPYISFPIKTKRESGVLFPNIVTSAERGLLFQQPIFFAPDDHYDFTFSPSIFGDSGEGIEVEHRYAINDVSSYTLNSLHSFDKIWEAEKTTLDSSGTRNLRQQIEFDLFYKPDYKNLFHFELDYLSDLDIIGNYGVFNRERFADNEKGLEVNYQRIFDNFYIDIYGSFKNNSFFQNAKGFDHEYVQTLPRIELAHNQLTLVEDFFFLNRLSFGQKVVFNHFKQNHADRGSAFRNVFRTDYTPYLKASYDISSVVDFNQEILFDYQSYRLTTLDDNNIARKHGAKITSTISFDIRKEFGKAYNYVSEPEIKEEISNTDLISDIPDLNEKSLLVKNRTSSHIHNANYQIIHRFNDPQKFSGNLDLLNSFDSNSNNFRFDDRDLIRGRDRNLQEESTRTSIAESNSLELQINNSLFRKTPKSNLNPYENFKNSNQAFDLSQVAFFNISQGIRLNTNEDDIELKNRLERLYVSTGFNFGSFSFSVSEYYFYTSSEHRTSLNLNHTIDTFSYNLEYIYDSFDASRRLFKYGFNFSFSDFLTFALAQSYNLEDKTFYSSSISARYIPNNNCWMLQFEMRRDDINSGQDRVTDSIQSIQLIINYDNKNFNSGPSIRI